MSTIQSAVKSIWDNIVHKKYYLTGGVGSGETSEASARITPCRTMPYCGNLFKLRRDFFQWKLHLAYHDAKYADLYGADAV